ncbi:hypothetical protein [Zunongwangia sp. HRR-M8]|uniref:hypothetical protein n=1 Tax=Zunongwangia sp. HRR-M8 TaxID=3015170 RepID=UPI0022DD33C1|nr:hypothetical protein [Zunongwangia sp. HRR-M8]WBL21117.1 hypothetical protein PBT89_10270 [Zunongwangia sp. HRR-M8]
MQILDKSINDDVQNLMVDVFESLSSNSSEIQPSELLATQPKLEEVFKLVKPTGFYELDDHLDLAKAIAIETEHENPEDEIMHTWVTMVNNLNTASSQEEFNARFALFTPVILKKMNTYKLSN